MAQLCSCDVQRPMLLEVFDADVGGSHDFIGRCEASLQQLQAAAVAGQGLPLVNPKKQGKPAYVSSGEGLGVAGQVTVIVNHAGVMLGRQPT